MLTEMVMGQPVETVKQISKDDVLEELGVPIGPARMKCALLGLKVLKAGLYGVVPSDDNL
jgi:nitrogen fixation NifU-like protein